jgi:hypothetical protein
MASDLLEYGKLATTIAIKEILGAKEQVLSGKQLTSEQVKYLGRCIGWLALVTAGQGEYDVFAILNTLCDYVISESNEGVDSQVSKLPARPPSIMAGGGKKDQPAEAKATGNPLLLQLILGALAVYFSGETAFRVYKFKADKIAIFKEAERQIDSSCPLDVLKGLRPEVDWSSTQLERDALKAFITKEGLCDGMKKIQETNKQAARNNLNEAYSNVPKAVGFLVTTASLVTMGPLAGTPGGLSSSFAAGASAYELVESIRASGGAPTASVAGFVNGVAAGFTSFSDSSSTAPAAPSMAPAAPPAAASAFTLPPTGGRRTRIKKTKKRSMKKFKKTRRGIRKPLFKY